MTFIWIPVIKYVNKSSGETNVYKIMQNVSNMFLKFRYVGFRINFVSLIELDKCINILITYGVTLTEWDIIWFILPKQTCRPI